MVRGHEPTVRLLVEYGADTNGGSPLLEALRRGHKDMAKLLVENGADVNARQVFTRDDGLPCWLYAQRTTRFFAETLLNFYGIRRLCLRPEERDPTERQRYLWVDHPLWVAAAIGDEHSVKLLLERGANADQYGTYSITPLQIATIGKHDAAMQLLAAATQNSEAPVEAREGPTVESAPNPQLGSKPSRSVDDDLQNSQATDRAPPNLQTSNPLAIQRLAISPKPQPQSPHDHSPKRPAHGPILEMQDPQGRKNSLDLLGTLSASKLKGDELSGDKDFELISSRCRQYMEDPFDSGIDVEYLVPTRS